MINANHTELTRKFLLFAQNLKHWATSHVLLLSLIYLIVNVAYAWRVLLVIICTRVCVSAHPVNDGVIDES